MRFNQMLWIVGAAAALAACAATEESKTAAPPKAAPAVQLPRDAGGDEPLPGAVRIASVERRRLATDGVVTYRVDNLKDTALHDLTWGVIFVYPSRNTGAIKLPYDSEVTPELELVLVGNERGRKLEARSTEFASRARAGDVPLSTKLILRQPPTIPTVARSSKGAGSRVLGGALEIVELSPSEELYAESGKLWALMENVFSEPVTNGQVRLRFVSSVDAAESLGTSPWTAVPAVAPGQRVRVDFDISSVSRDVARRSPFVIWGRRDNE